MGASQNLFSDHLRAICLRLCDSNFWDGDHYGTKSDADFRLLDRVDRGWDLDRTGWQFIRRQTLGSHWAQAAVISQYVYFSRSITLAIID